MRRDNPRRALRRPRRQAAGGPGEASAGVPARPDVLEMTVGPVAHGGSCVARIDAGARGAPVGLVVFVRHALPGERVLARVTETGRRFWRADAVQVLEASPDRVSAPCPHAGPGRCGGCDWQHVRLARQRELKAQVVREQLRRLAGLAVDVQVAPVPADPATGAGDAPLDDGLGWRTRLQFAVAADGSAGLHRHRSTEVEPLEACPIAVPAVNASGALAARWSPGTTVDVLAAPQGVRVAGTPTGGWPPGGPGGSGAGTRAGLGDPAGRPQLLASGSPVTYAVAGRSFRVSPGSFWQVHPAAAATLSSTVADLLQPRPGERALDLYAGVGLFAARLAERVGPGGSVLAVEGLSGAAADARYNLADLPQAMVREASVSPRLVAAAGQPQLVVLDPPRSGAGLAVMAALGELGPRAIGYVACDPAALARDVAAAATTGYRLAALRAYDLFPMTAHVECVALLERGP